MSNDLLTQLAEYGVDHEDRQRAQTADDIVGSVVPLPVPVARSIQPRAIIIVIAAAAVVLAVGVLPVFLARNDGPPATPTTVPPAPSTTVPPSPSTTAATPTTIPPAPTTTVVLDSLAPPVVEWEQVDFASDEGPQGGGVVSTGDGFAVFQRGYEAWDESTSPWTPVDIDGDTQNIMWTSLDGLTWERTIVEGPWTDGPNWTSLSGVAHGTYIMHFGPEQDGQGCVNCLSTDLKTWTPWELEPSGGAFTDSVMWIVSTDTAIVGRKNFGIVVTDTDFSETEVLEPFGEAGDGGVSALAATRDTFYALVYSNSTGRSTVWSSTDGRSWEPALVDLPPNGGIAEQHWPAMAANDDRVLVYIDRGRHEGPFWMAESGEPFVRLTEAPTRAGDPMIVATGDGFVVSFTTGFGNGAISSFGPYATTNGTQWNEIDPAGASIGTWATHGSAIVGATGSWVVELGEDGLVSGEYFQYDGTWIMGTTSPAS